MRAAVLGAGTMGHGIAQVLAMAGHDVALQDVDPDALDEAAASILQNFDKGVELGKVDPKVAQKAPDRIYPTTDVAEAVADADVVVEAVPEEMELKRDVWSTVSDHVDADALLATNTSSLSIDDVARAVDGPDRFLGMHFFNPVHIMDLVEVVVGEATSDDAADRAVDLAGDLGKTPIVVRDSPGFATSRLGIVLGNEAIRMVEQGVASIEDVDTAMELGYNHPVGPLKLSDMVGLDVRYEVSTYLHEELGGDHYAPPKLLEEKVKAGDLGQKTGRGFYDWSGDEPTPTDG